MGRLWCLLGLHDWLTEYDVSGGFTAYPTRRSCLRKTCKREETWHTAKRVAVNKRPSWTWGSGDGQS